MSFSNAITNRVYANVLTNSTENRNRACVYVTNFEWDILRKYLDKDNI